MSTAVHPQVLQEREMMRTYMKVESILRNVHSKHEREWQKMQDIQALKEAMHIPY
jgi:hypothetical protein